MNRASTCFASREKLPAYRTAVCRGPWGSDVARSSRLHHLRLGGLDAFAQRARSEAVGTSPCAASSHRGDCHLGSLLCRMRLRLAAAAYTRGLSFADCGFAPGWRLLLGVTASPCAAVLVAAKASVARSSRPHHQRLAGLKTLAPQDLPRAPTAPPCGIFSRRGTGPARRKGHPPSFVNAFMSRKNCCV